MGEDEARGCVQAGDHLAVAQRPIWTGEAHACVADVGAQIDHQQDVRGYADHPPA